MTIERISSRPITSTLHKAFSLWVLFTLILSGCGKFPPAGQPGVMFRLDPEHSGVYTISAQASPVEWKFKTEAAVYSSPVISGDVLFAASFDGKLYAIDPITGKKVWQYDSQAGIYSSPVVYEGVVYFGNANGVIFAVDIESRQQKWQYQTQGPVHSSPAVANGNVYAGSGDGHLYALDARTGEEKWIFKPGGPVFSSPTVDQGVVYFGSGDGYVYALDAKTGEEKWAYQAKDWIFSSPALSGNLLFFGSHDKNLYAIDVTSHELKWSFETGGIIESSPTISDGTVYFGSSDGYLYALDAATGNEKWRFSTQSEVYSSPAVLDGAVYFGSFNGRFYAVDAANGTELWNIRTDGRVYSSPALTDDMAYYGSEDGNFYAVSRRGPQSANLFPAPTPLPFQVTPEGSTALPPLQPAGYSWWNDQVFYEVFIRSFRDASGDGAGDIQGLIDKLDYLNDGDPATNQDLGITALLLLPVSEAASPHGYDAIDFEQVEQDFGSNADFQRLVSEAHRRGIKIVLELALNQTSNQHPWFVDSQTPGSEHDHWYVWSNGNPGYTGPQGELLWFPAGSRYYYAHFAEAMPDLNLRNPAVTGALYDVARFWLEDMQVDGFRLSAADQLIEDGRILEDTPGTHTWLRGFYSHVSSLAPSALVVGDIDNIGPQIVPYTRDQVDIAQEQDLTSAIIDSLNQGDSRLLRLAQERVLRFYPPGQYLLYLTDPMQARVIDYLNDDIDAARLAASLLLTNPGVPMIYFGDEIGMSGQASLGVISEPMQWDSTPENAGFTEGQPWTRLSPLSSGLNVVDQAADPDSLWSHYRTMIALRLAHPALQTGEMVMVESDHPAVYSFLRSSDEEQILAVANLSGEPVSSYSLKLDSGPLSQVNRAELLFGTGQTFAPTLNQNGGFDRYIPLPILPPHSIYLIRLAN